MKGLRENAEQGISTGGTPPFGYSRDLETRKLVINEDEAPGVRLIFQMTLDGCSYTEISIELNKSGHQTRYGNKFGTNSIHDILKNEKYMGTYIYNKQASAKKGTKQRRSPHKLKAPSEWIIRENDIPPIISKADFERVQEMMKNRKHTPGTGKAKQTYVLSGKIRCGECGSTYAGNRRKANERQGEAITYRCNRNQKTTPCKNKEISRESLESNVLLTLSNVVYDPQKLDEVVTAFARYHAEQDGGKRADIERIEKRCKENTKMLDNTANAIALRGFSETLNVVLDKLEDEKRVLQAELAKAKQQLNTSTLDPEEIRAAFFAAKSAFEQGELPEVKAIAQKLVEEVTVYPDKVEVALNLGSEKLSNVLADLDKKSDGRNQNVSAIGISPQYEGLVEQVKGIEPSYSAWEADVLPLNYTCKWWYLEP